MSGRPVVVLGDVMTDVLTRLSGPVATGSDTGASTRLLGGGSGANVAAWLGSQGADVSFVGRVGDDDLGRSAVEQLRRHGVRTQVGFDPDRPSGTCVVLVDPSGERSMLPDVGANAALTPEHLPRELFVTGSHLHLSGYTLLTEGSREAGLAALELAADAGMTVSIDPASVAPLRAVGVARFLSWCRGISLLMPNDDELHLLAGGQPLPADVLVGDRAVAESRTAAGTRASRAPVAQALAAELGAVVVATCGAAGALAVRPGAGRTSAGRVGGAGTGRQVPTGAGSPSVDPADQRVLQADAEPVRVVDTTGCGDAFAAGFLHRWIEAADLGAALRLGSAWAAGCATRLGGRPPG